MRIDGLWRTCDDEITRPVFLGERSTSLGTTVLLKGQFAAISDPEILDMCVLGRDITNLFALAVDRAQGVVCMVGGEHSWAIVRR